MAERKRKDAVQLAEERAEQREVEAADRKAENKRLFAANRAHRFMKGHPKMGGRQKGTPNRATQVLRDGLMAAAERAGYVERDSRGHRIATGVGGIEGFLSSMAVHDPNLWVKLMQAMLAAEINGKFNVTVNANVKFNSAEEIRAYFKERNIPLPTTLKLLPPPSKQAIANS